MWLLVERSSDWFTHSAVRVGTLRKKNCTLIPHSNLWWLREDGILIIWNFRHPNEDDCPERTSSQVEPASFLRNIFEVYNCSHQFSVHSCGQGQVDKVVVFEYDNFWIESSQWPVNFPTWQLSVDHAPPHSFRKRDMDFYFINKGR